jgi:hypothetical protein
VPGDASVTVNSSPLPRRTSWGGFARRRFAPERGLAFQHVGEALALGRDACGDLSTLSATPRDQDSTASDEMPFLGSRMQFGSRFGNCLGFRGRFQKTTRSSTCFLGRGAPAGVRLLHARRIRTRRGAQGLVYRKFAVAAIELFREAYPEKAAPLDWLLVPSRRHALLCELGRVAQPRSDDQGVLLWNEWDISRLIDAAFQLSGGTADDQGWRGNDP